MSIVPYTGAISNPITTITGTDNLESLTVSLNETTRKSGRRSDDVWNMFTVVTTPHRLQSAVCMHCNCEVTYRKKSERVKAHLVKCGFFIQKMLLLEVDQRPPWFNIGYLNKNLKTESKREMNPKTFGKTYILPRQIKRKKENTKQITVNASKDSEINKPNILVPEFKNRSKKQKSSNDAENNSPSESKDKSVSTTAEMEKNSNSLLTNIENNELTEKSNENQVKSISSNEVKSNEVGVITLPIDMNNIPIHDTSNLSLNENTETNENQKSKENQIKSKSTDELNGTETNVNELQMNETVNENNSKTHESNQKKEKKKEKETETEIAKESTKDADVSKSMEEERKEKENMEQKEAMDEKEGKKKMRKRARLPFVFFSMENRKLVQEENPHVKKNPQMILKTLSEKWKNLDANKRQKYVEMSLKEKMQLESFNASSPKTETSTEEKSKKSKKSSEMNEKKDEKMIENNQNNQNNIYMKPIYNQNSNLRNRRLRYRNINKIHEKTLNYDGDDDDNDDNDNDDDDGDGDGVKEMNNDKKVTNDFSEFILNDNMEEAGELEFVIGKTLDGKYITKRKCMDYALAEAEDHPLLKKMKSGEAGEGGGGDVDEEEKKLISAIEKFQRRQLQLKKELDKRVKSGSLVLDDLEEGSPLEMLEFLGNMRKEMFPSPRSKLPSPDVWMQVPMIGFCQLIQSMLDGERAIKNGLIAKIERLEDEKKRLEAKSSEKESAAT